MSVSTQIKALLSMTGKKQSDLLNALNMASKQSLSNKFSGERWSASDLVTIAEFTGCKLAFLLPNGERLVIDTGTRGGYDQGTTLLLDPPSNAEQENGI